MSATLSSGYSLSPIPPNTYGVAAAVFPHAINEPSFGAGASYTAGTGPNGNLRFF